MTLTWPLVKASFIAKVQTVHAVDTGLRDRHTDGFALDKAIVKGSFIAKVHTVHAVAAGLRDRHSNGFALEKAIVKASFRAKVHTVDADLRETHKWVCP